jgi:preprotein translocase SecF subunit
LIIAGITAFFVRGNKNFGVDFTGGTLQEFKFEREVDLAAMRKALTDTGIKNASIQGLAGNKDVLIRTPEDVYPQINSKLKETFADNKFELMRVEKVGPSVGKLLKQKAAGALFWGLVIILIYVAWRFKHWEYGLAGIIALFHDVFVAVGAMALAGMEFDLNTVAAVLTIVGFSINDTVVIYDRIRENMRLLRKTTFTELINLSVNQTLSRTIFTTFTAQLTVVSLLFWGGEVLKGFSFCLFVGFLSGVYSTVFIASPLLIVWQRKKK